MLRIVPNTPAHPLEHHSRQSRSGHLFAAVVAAGYILIGLFRLHFLMCHDVTRLCNTASRHTVVER